MATLPSFDVPDDAVVEVLRRMTPAERLTVANNMWVSVRNALEYMLRAEHQDWSEEQLRQEIARRMLRGAV